MQELDLILGCKQNDYKAQMQVYELYKDVLYNASWRILKNDHDAQDVVHDAFIRGFKNIDQLKDTMNLKAWLKRIAINRSLDILKKRKRIQWVEEVHDISMNDSEANSMEINNSMSITDVMSCMNQLKEKYRIVIVLYLIDGYGHKEIAELLNTKESTIRNQYARGKKQLQELIKVKLGA